MKVAAPIRKVNVGDVAAPELIARRWHEALDEVLPLAEAVVGVSRVAGTPHVPASSRSHA